LLCFTQKKMPQASSPHPPSLSWATHGAPRATGYHPTQDRLWWPAAGPWPSQSRLHPRPNVSHLSLPTPSSSRPTIMSFLTVAGHRGPIQPPPCRIQPPPWLDLSSVRVRRRWRLLCLCAAGGGSCRFRWGAQRYTAPGPCPLNLQWGGGLTAPPPPWVAGGPWPRCRPASGGWGLLATVPPPRVAATA
jgi:hypothetical protein